MASGSPSNSEIVFRLFNSEIDFDQVRIEFGMVVSLLKEVRNEFGMVVPFGMMMRMIVKMRKNVLDFSCDVQGRATATASSDERAHHEPRRRAR